MASKTSASHGFDLDSFNYADKLKVLTVLELLDEPAAIKFLQKMRQRNMKAFMWHLYTQAKLRALVLRGLNHIAEDRSVLGTLTVTRQVINNPRMASESQKVFAVSIFDVDHISRFVKKHCEAYDRFIACINVV